MPQQNCFWPLPAKGNYQTTLPHPTPPFSTSRIFIFSLPLFSFPFFPLFTFFTHKQLDIFFFVFIVKMESQFYFILFLFCCCSVESKFCCAVHYVTQWNHDVVVLHRYCTWVMPLLVGIILY